MAKKIESLVSGLCLALVLGLAGCGLTDVTNEENSIQGEEILSMEVGQGTLGVLEGATPTDNSRESLSYTQGTEEAVPGDGPDAAESIQEPQPPAFEEAGDDYYAYHTLSEEEQIWYRDINEILGNMKDRQELSPECFEAGMGEDDIDSVFQCVLNDHPEYFYVEGYTYTKYTRLNRLVKLEFSGTYSMDPEEARKRQGEIRQAAAEILEEAPMDGSDYDKVKYVYDTLIRSTEYRLGAPDDQNIYSVFVNGVSVCQGYAKATQYLLNRLGVPCTMVTGRVDTGEGHAWNLVSVDGAYYYLDTTWGDASYRADGEVSFAMPQINYDYLCVTSEQLFKTHTLDPGEEMPLCESLAANYYVKEGTYFTGCDTGQLEDVFARMAESGKKEISIKCSDQTVYEEIRQKLIDDQEIFTYLKDGGKSIAYAQNEKQLSLSFWVTNE